MGESMVSCGFSLVCQPIEWPYLRPFQGEDSGETDVLLGERRLRLERRWPRRVDRQPRGSGAHPDAGDAVTPRRRWMDGLDGLDGMGGSQKPAQMEIEAMFFSTDWRWNILKYGETWWNQQDLDFHQQKVDWKINRDETKMKQKVGISPLKK